MRTAIITGAYGAIGRSIARKIAEAGYRTCLVGRDGSRLKSAVDDIVKKTGNPDVFAEVVDLSSGTEITGFARRWNGPLSILVNNAATAPRKRTLSSEGVEMQFAVNVLSYFRMINAFREFLNAGEGSRVVNVASYWAGGLDLSDIEFSHRAYDNDSAYRQSKQADRMLTVIFAEKLQNSGITVNSCHPGDVNSKLSNDLGFGGHETPDEGAATPAWLALSPEVKDQTGHYFAHRRQAFCEFSADRDGIVKLFETCSSY